MSEEQGQTPQAALAPQSDDSETIDDAIDPGVTAVVESTPLPSIDKPRKRHPLIWGVVVIFIVGFLPWGGWVMLFKHVSR